MEAISILGVTTPFHSMVNRKNRLSSYSPSPRRYFTMISASATQQSLRGEVFESMEKWADKNLLVHLKPVEKSWQPHDILPDAASDGFFEEVMELQKQAKQLPDEFVVALVGDMVTEEALPTYHSVINAKEGFTDETGADLTPFQTWTRGWSAEENRHGDLLNKYLYLSGRVDMKQVEKTTHYLIKSGMNLGGKRDPYCMTIYTSFQERATFISHRRTASLAQNYGNPKLAQICSTIASDEKRHEIAYTSIVQKLFELDPTNAVLTFAEMLKNKITMPGHLMFDGQDPDLFFNFVGVSSRLGVYSASDYIDVMEHLLETWNVEKLTGLSGEGRRAQEYVCTLPKRLRKVQEIRVHHQNAKEAPPKVKFSWIFGKLL